MRLHLRTAPAALAFAIVAGAVAVATAAPPSATAPERLQALLAGSRLVVTGRVADVAAYDDGKLAVATIAVTQTLKGDDPGESVRVLETRSLPSLPPVFSAGDQVLVFLAAARPSSYVREHLPAGTYWQPASPAASGGVLAAADAPTIGQAAALVGRMASASREPESDAAKRRAAERALVFDELGARHPAVVEDGIAGLATLPALAPTSDAERAVLANAVTRDDLPARVRERLFATVARLQLAELVPALRTVRSDDAAVTAAAWQALRALGAAPDADEIAAGLASKDATVRAAAARELLARDVAGELDRAGALALSDPDPKVRIAVVEALAASGDPVVIVVLEKAYVAPELTVAQAAGRAIFQIGGRPASESFARLAFSAPPEMQRHAVTMLRATGVASDDPLLVKIRNEHPEPEVREVAEHGLPVHEH